MLLIRRISTSISATIVLLVVLIQISACALRSNVAVCLSEVILSHSQTCENLGFCCNCDIVSARYSYAKALKETE